MKKTFFIALAIVSFGLISCSQEEKVNGNEVSQQNVEENFTVLEEKEFTGDELFAQSMSSLEGYVDSDIIERINTSFEEAYNELPSTGEQTRTLPLPLYKTVRITYPTADESGKTVQASALIVYPLLKRIKNVMLINHGTQIGFMMVPTGYTSVEAIMAATGSLCILPDYIGLGSTAKHPDLYLNHEVHGTTSVDALLTLLDFAKSKRLPLESDYNTYIVGYSQGGSVSLASLRQVQRLDEATQKRIHLKKVFCGDGPYDLRLTFETYLNDFHNGKPLGLGSVIPLVINSMFNSYPAELEGMKYEDFFTDWALKTGVPQAIRNNKEGILDMMLKLYGADLDKILNMKYIEENPDDLERLLCLMDRQNLCKGWTPKYPLKLLHCNPDGVVPFANFEEASAYLKNEYVETQVVPINSNILKDALLQHIFGMTVMLEQILSGKF